MTKLGKLAPTQLHVDQDTCEIIWRVTGDLELVQWGDRARMTFVDEESGERLTVEGKLLHD